MFEAEHLGLIGWIYTAVAGVIGGVFGVGATAGKYGNRIDHVEGDVASGFDRVEKRLDQIHADVRSINETISRR